MRVVPQIEGAIHEATAYGQGCLIRIEGAMPDAQPGQFVHLLCGNDSGRILRRPFSIMDRRDGLLTILVKVVGGGTAWLTERRPGDRVDLLSPLGQGFDPDMCKSPLLVAGGTGLAPLYFLARRLKETGVEARLLWGLNCGEDFGGLPARLGDGADLVIATCDGSSGLQGTAVDLLKRQLEEGGYDGLFACGPQAMLAALGPLLEEYGMLCQVSVEQRMACGIGACFGCSVPRRDGKTYARACADGPVFDYTALDWSDALGGEDA